MEKICYEFIKQLDNYQIILKTELCLKYLIILIRISSKIQVS